MRRALQVALLILLAAVPCFAQYSAPSEDSQMGLTAVPCTNTSTTFEIVKAYGHMIFCTPSGHVLPMARGFYGMDLNLIGGSDESGGTTSSYATTKYGTSTVWAQQTVQLFKGWGENSEPTYANSNLLPMTNTQKAPFIIFEIMSAYSLVDKLGWNANGCAAHELYSAMSPNWGGFTRNGNADGLADYEDPSCWAGMITGVLTNSTNSTQIASAPTATKNLLLGFSFDDSDTTHCLGASKDFTTRPVSGNNDFSCAYMAMFVAPMQEANTVQAETYVDATVYLKKWWLSRAQTEYATIGALNTAWGSSYTTFGTSGTCVGTHLPNYITTAGCGATAAADSVGTGNGTNLGPFTATLSHTTVSGLSLGIYVNGVLVGGDPSTGAVGGGCKGTIYGPTLTGSTLNCSTGAVSVTFTAGNAPANGAAITAEYIANGWNASGTGFLDEDCRSGHSSYCGNGSGSTTVNLTGVNANLVTDLNNGTQDYANHYFSSINSALQTWAGAHGFTGHVPYLGPTTLGTWGTPPNAPVIKGMCGQIDAWSYGGANALSQAELDYVKTNCATDMGIIDGEYLPAGAQSEQAWPGSSATHSGTTVTITVATPNKVSALGTLVLYDVSCTATDYNLTNFHPATAGATTFTYTLGVAPSETSTTCNFWPDDSQVGGFATTALKGAGYKSDATSLFSLCFTTDSVCPFVGVWKWEWYNDWSDKHAWGWVTIRGNPENGSDDVNASVTCQAPDAAFSCGGELALHNPSYGDLVTPLEQANTTLDNDFLALPSATPVVPTPTSPIAQASKPTQQRGRH